MKTTVDAIETFAEPAAPALERELEQLGFPFYMMAPEVRMRSGASCGIVSETLRQALEVEGVQAELFIRDVPEPGRGEHVIQLIETDGPRIVVDGSYAQLLQPYGLDWLDGFDGRVPRFPEPRVLVFKDGQQEAVGEWLAMVASLANRSTPTTEAARYFSGLYDLGDYESYEAVDYVRKDAARLREAVWPAVVGYN